VGASNWVVAALSFHLPDGRGSAKDFGQKRYIKDRAISFRNSI
jgi:hypothetical protein